MNACFQFKQFAIADNRCAQKVGTDSILLGSWACADDPKTILDIGSGSGLLSLMMAQKFPDSSITSIEIEINAVQQSKENIDFSAFKNHFEVYHDDFLKHDFDGKFDLIISNPPYFFIGIKPNNKTRKIARHNEGLPVEEFIKKSISLLSPSGKIALVSSFQNLEEIKEIVAKCKKNISRICYVSSFKNTATKLVLLEISNTKILQIEYISIYKQEGIYSHAFMNLTVDFYLNLK